MDMYGGGLALDFVGLGWEGWGVVYVDFVGFGEELGVLLAF
jgi:hypothetical protein